MNLTTLATCFLLFITGISAQNPRSQPKLVVGVIVDQMRYDYITRYWEKYGNGGFKRLLKEGFSCENTHYDYVPTFTGPGHAAIYTGAPPSVNGIIGNDWWDIERKEKRYVTSDTNYKVVGGAEGKAGQHSPAVLLSTTITDELRLSNNFKSKVIGICLKDRGSILPAGHIPNACYWFDDLTGNWITSTYYPDSLGLAPWVTAFNEKKLPDRYLAQTWTKALTETYHESFDDWKQYEDARYMRFEGDFPYNLTALKQKHGNYGILRFTPFGNTLTLDFTLEAIDQMELGKDQYADFLCVSFSSTDYCGHQFGIHSEETEDTYIRFDADIERLLKGLDEKVGAGQYLLFLTSDHGGSETPDHMKSLRIPAGVFEESKLKEKIEAKLGESLNMPKGNYIHDIINQQIWINREAIFLANKKPEEVINLIAKYVSNMPGVYGAMSKEAWMTAPAEYPYAVETRRGFYPRRSGDVIFQLEPGWHAEDKYFAGGGATHGSPYAYDTHVPLFWYGWHVRPGETFAPVSITDIAPTLAAFLRIMEPNGTTGKVIEALFRN